MKFHKTYVCEEDQHDKPCQKPWIYKCQSSSGPRPIKSASNSIRYNCEKICSRSRRPRTILEIRKKATFFYVINNPIIYKFFKDFTNYRKKTDRAVVFSWRSFPNILKYRDHWWNLPAIWRKRLFKIQLLLTNNYVRVIYLIHDKMFLYFRGTHQRRAG